VACWSADHNAIIAIALFGLLAWCVAVPTFLTFRLGTLGIKRYSQENQRVFGFYIAGFDPRFWMWNLVVKRGDIALVMVITYTSLARTDRDKLLILPLVSGVILALTCSAKPYSDEQGELLDSLEKRLQWSRFILFSSIASLMTVSLPPSVAVTVFAFITSVLLFQIGYVCVHFLYQYLRDEDEKDKPLDLGWTTFFFARFLQDS